MDEVTIMDPPAPQRSGLILEHVPAIHDALLEEAGDWSEVAAYQRTHVFSKEDAKDDDLRRYRFAPCCLTPCLPFLLAVVVTCIPTRGSS